MKRFTLHNLNPLTVIRQRLTAIEVCNQKMVQLLCNLIPSHCPFEHTIKFGDCTLIHIPPLCKLNSLYDQLVELRFKALCYLAEHIHPPASYIN